MPSYPRAMSNAFSITTHAGNLGRQGNRPTTSISRPLPQATRFEALRLDAYRERNTGDFFSQPLDEDRERYVQLTPYFDFRAGAELCFVERY